MEHAISIMEYLHKGDAAVASADTLYSARIYRLREYYNIAYEIRNEKRHIKSTVNLSSLSSISKPLLD